MGRKPDDQAVERLLGERGQHLMRAAVALTGSRTDGEDLLQAALERLLQNWSRVDTDAEGYLRRTLYNLAADGWRRRGRWRGRLAEFRSQARAEGTGSDDVAVVDLRDTLVRLLQQLPPRQRAVVVLRYWEQRSEAETAELLGCTEGTVKSAASRGLRRLRELAGSGRAGERARPPKRARAEDRSRSGRRKIMNGAVEDLLREGLDRLTAEVEVPSGVTGRARSHLRRKKMAVRAALAGGAAAVTAAAVVAATAPGQDTTGPLQARTAAYVLTQGGQCPGDNEQGHPDRDRLQRPVSPGHGLELPGGHAAHPVRVHRARPGCWHALGPGTGALGRRHHQGPRAADLRADRLPPSRVGQRGDTGIRAERVHRPPGHRGVQRPGELAGLRPSGAVLRAVQGRGLRPGQRRTHDQAHRLDDELRTSGANCRMARVAARSGWTPPCT